MPSTSGKQKLSAFQASDTHEPTTGTTRPSSQQNDEVPAATQAATASNPEEEHDTHSTELQQAISNSIQDTSSTEQYTNHEEHLWRVLQESPEKSKVRRDQDVSSGLKFEEDLWQALNESLKENHGTNYGAGVHEPQAGPSRWRERARERERIEKKRREEQISREDCGICLGRMHSPTTAPCFHTFCRECLLLWLRQKETCPKCRGRCRRGDLVDLLGNGQAGGSRGRRNAVGGYSLRG